MFPKGASLRLLNVILKAEYNVTNPKEVIIEIFDIHYKHQIDGSMLDCSISIADALEILQSCTKPLKCNWL